MNASSQRWLRFLKLAEQSSASWHHARIREELRERRHACSRLRRLSETADVFFSIQRARSEGVKTHDFPDVAGLDRAVVIGYVMAKFTSRWLFYRVAARLCGCAHYRSIREVVNPAKTGKLLEVAHRHRLDGAEFCRMAHRLRAVWPLLP